MSLDRNQLSDLITRLLSDIDLFSPAARNLLLGTCAQESAFGTYIRQIGGPALGIFQMEPDTEYDIWFNFLRHRSILKTKLWSVCRVDGPDPEALEANLAYQIGIARIHYLRVAEPIPDHDDLFGLACYWKAHYNTPRGRGTIEGFINNFQKYVGQP
jgi:hypothetical protein